MLIIHNFLVIKTIDMLTVIIQSLFDVTIDKNITFLKTNFPKFANQKFH